jgi:nucleotide-binding universal stress UspA family protein
MTDVWNRLETQMESETKDLRRHEPTLAISLELREGGAASDVLAAEAEDVDADLVVVASSSHDDLPRPLLGSTASDLVLMTSRPVVVARGDAMRVPGRGTTVVIGVGELGFGNDAAQFALDFASRHKLRVRAVHMRSDSTFALIAEELTTEQRNAAAAEQEVVHATVVAEVDAWREARPELVIDREEVEEQPRRFQALLDRSADAALLVVGSHRRGPWRRVVLGPISHAVLHYAPCPVAVIRQPDEDQTTGQS